jgi:hypothetical protein
MTVSLLPSAPLQQSVPQPKWEASTPRAVAIINGTNYQISAYTVSANAHGATDTATVTIPISSNPDFSLELFKDANDQTPVYVEIYAGFPATPAVSLTDISQLSRRFVGVVDQYTAKFGTDQIIFNCRSFAAPLVDNFITTYTQNQTTQAFIAQQAAAIGLPVKFNLPYPARTIQEVLAYDNIGGANIAGTVYKMRIWDLILRCAQVDDVDVWVDSTPTLHYEAPWLVSRNSVPMNWLRDFEVDGLEATHSPQFSRNIQVEVHTYQKRVKVATSVRVTTDPISGESTIEQTSRTVTSAIVPGTNQTIATATAADGTVTVTSSTGSGGSFSAAGSQAAGESGKEKYIFYVRNVSPQLANQKARNLWRQISMHEFAITGKFPMTKALLLTLSITSLVKVANLPYAFANDTYWPRSLNEAFDLQAGWVVDMHAVNHQLPANAV